MPFPGPWSALPSSEGCASTCRRWPTAWAIRAGSSTSCATWSASSRPRSSSPWSTAGASRWATRCFRGAVLGSVLPGWPWPALRRTSSRRAWNTSALHAGLAPPPWRRFGEPLSASSASARRWLGPSCPWASSAAAWCPRPAPPRCAARVRSWSVSSPAPPPRHELVGVAAAWQIAPLGAAHVLLHVQRHRRTLHAETTSHPKHDR